MTGEFERLDPPTWHRVVDALTPLARSAGAVIMVCVSVEFDTFVGWMGVIVGGLLALASVLAERRTAYVVPVRCAHED